MRASEADQRGRVQGLLLGLWNQIETPGPASPLLTTVLELNINREPVRLGRDREGLPHLLVPLEEKYGRMRMPGGQGLSVVTRDLLVDDHPSRFLDVGCLRADLTHVFAGLAVDICMRLLEGSESSRAVITAVDEWRALVERDSAAWTPSRCAGLFGELIIVDRLMDLNPYALAAWTGPFGAAQDFRTHLRAIEVKTTLSAERRVVRIHGSDQLEEPAGGALHLVWFRLGEPPDGTGATVRSMIARISDRVQDLNLWARCLSTLRLPSKEHPELDKRRFSIIEEKWYAVDDAFPRLVPASFKSCAIPGGVGGVEYLVDLDVVPGDNGVQEAGETLARLAGVR